MLLHIQQRKLHIGLISHVLGTTTFRKRECKRMGNVYEMYSHTASACRSRMTHLRNCMPADFVLLPCSYEKEGCVSSSSTSRTLRQSGLFMFRLESWFVERSKRCHSKCNAHLTRFNKIATQGAPQMTVDKEANSSSRVYSYYSKFNLCLFYV